MRIFRIVTLLVLLTLVGRTSADNLTVEKVRIAVDGQQQVGIQLVNPDAEYVAFQCDLTLPSGITIDKDENGKLVASLNTERASDHLLTVKEVGTGLYRILVYSMQNTAFTGQSGTLVNVLLKNSAGIGNYEGLISSVVLTDTNKKLHKPENSSFAIKVATSLTVPKGDVNDDGDVDIADAVCIVNYIVGKPNVSFVSDAADVNEDGDIDIADAVQIVNFVVGKINAL